MKEERRILFISILLLMMVAGWIERHLLTHSLTRFSLKSPVKFNVMKYIDYLTTAVNQSADFAGKVVDATINTFLS